VGSYFAGAVMVTGALKSAQTSSASAAESVRRRANRDLPVAAVASADRGWGILRYLHVARSAAPTC
jgi:hypothetical protein